MLLKCNQL